MNFLFKDTIMTIERIVIIFLLCMLTPGAFGGERPDYNEVSAYYGFQDMEVIKLDQGVNALRIMDFNADGRNDIAIVNNKKARIELLVQKEQIGPGEEEIVVDPEDTDINILNPQTRFDNQSLAVSQKVTSFVCGDLNTDGRTDLAYYGEPKGLYIILQDISQEQSPETFKLNWRTRKKINIDDGISRSSALVCADLNTDGRDDLALAGSDKVYVIIQNEDGSLAEPVQYPSASNVLGVDAVDLDGDGINDLVLVTSDKERMIHIRFGLKTGQLGPLQRFFVERPSMMDFFDIDGEPGEEVLTVDARSGRLVCYKLRSKAKAADRDDDWPVKFFPLPSGEGDIRRDLVTGDFDGDGMEDVVISDPAAAELIFYRQIEGVGLSRPVRFPALADVTNLSACDIDEDDKCELAALSVKEKVIGISEFSDERLSFPKPLDLIGEPLAMELSDMDNDGDVDCVYISKDENDGRGLNVIYSLDEPDVVQTGIEHDAVGESNDTHFLTLEKLEANPDGMKVIDVDQDGLLDILLFIKYESPMLIHQTGQREFHVVDSPKTQASLIREAGLRSAATANVSGDDAEELLIAQNNFARSLIFSGGKRWTIVDQYNAKSKENRVAVVDAFNIEDSKEPAIFLLDGQKGYLQILKAGKDKTYRFADEVDVGQWNIVDHLKMLFGSFSGGKAKNILLFDSRKFALVSAPGAKITPWELERKFSYETKIKDGGYGNLTAGDINSDGLIDIIVAEYIKHHIEILAVDNDMNPLAAMRFKIFEEKSYRQSRQQSRTVEPREMKVADVTGDGADDLVTVIHDRIIIYPQDY